jgi:hypothetical protein
VIVLGDLRLTDSLCCKLWVRVKRSRGIINCTYKYVGNRQPYRLSPPRCMVRPTMGREQTLLNDRRATQACGREKQKKYSWDVEIESDVMCQLRQRYADL